MKSSTVVKNKVAKKSSVTRRNFLKGAAAVMATTAVSSSSLLSSNRRKNLDKLRNRLYSSEFPFAYDTESFESSERVFFEDKRPYINIFVRAGKTLDIKLYTADTETGLYGIEPINLIGVRDSLDIPISRFYGPRFYYKIEYRDGKNWKTLEARTVKTPNVDIEKDGKVKIILKGDDHVYADLKHQPPDENWRKDVLDGNYVSKMLKEIIADPNYIPEFGTQKVVYGFTLAHTLKYILESKPDFIIDVGDTVGPDSYSIWGTKGQWPEFQPEDSLEKQSRILWERKRRSLSAITPEIPYYLALGNHDGEVGWYTDTLPFTQPYSRAQRKRLFRQPSILRLIEKLRISSEIKRDWLFNNSDQNYFPVVWANGDVRFLLLDVNSYLEKKPKEITDWTLGDRQKTMARYILSDGYDVPWKFICYHNTVGGYPLGSGTYPGAYGRGPLFTREDYTKINEIDPNMNINPDNVEQVWLTEVAKDFNVRGFFYGHDHVFFEKNIGKTSQGKDIIGACVGATVYSGPRLWQNLWCNPYWMEYYGLYLQDSPQFLTSPGITEIEIDKDGATVKYVCTAPIECMYTNMPIGTKPGDVLREYRLSK